jgi:hypothetical protein
MLLLVTLRCVGNMLPLLTFWIEARPGSEVLTGHWDVARTVW